MADDQSKPRSVLFVCTMNAVRSPMAAGLLRHLKGRELYVESAGVHAGELDPMTIQVMAELGITLNDHHPKSFEEFRGQDFDLVVAVQRGDLTRRALPNDVPRKVTRVILAGVFDLVVQDILSTFKLPVLDRLAGQAKLRSVKMPA